MHLKRKEGVEIWGNKISKQSISERLFHQNYGAHTLPSLQPQAPPFCRSPAAGTLQSAVCSSGTYSVRNSEMSL